MKVERLLGFKLAQLLTQKVLWSNEVLDGCSKNPVVMKTKEGDGVCCNPSINSKLSLGF